MAQQLKKTAVYCRLSKDDERQGESLSIEIQKSMLCRYCDENGLTPYEVFADDGYSGLNFERPDFQRMLDGIAAGEIGTVIVKDLSRFGRDHIKVGEYTEIYFPSKRIRFIALNDGIDTINSHTTDYAAIKNVINEFYSRDTSRKIKASFRARAKDGKYHAKNPPYGYLKDPADHNHLIPDPETAWVIRKIYELVLKGWGNYKIRDYLREAKCPVPSWYIHVRGIEDKSHMFPTEESKYIWRPDTLRMIIRNRVYCGDIVMCRTDTVFKTKKHHKSDENTWITVENTHEPLVSKDIWERANELISVKRHAAQACSYGEENIFAGLLKCADCGMAMTRRRYGSNSPHRIYVCTSYATYGAKKCSQHKIFEDDLKEAVLADIQDLAVRVRKNESKFIEYLIKAQAKVKGKNSDLREAEYKKICKRIEELNKLIDGLYEEKIMKRLSEENYDRLLRKYQSEQETMLSQKVRLDFLRDEVKDLRSDAERFAALLHEYETVTVLDPEILNMLIERIDVHEPSPVDGVMRQQVDITYRFIGAIRLIDYGATTFYKTEKVLQAAKTRAKRSSDDRIAAVKEEIAQDAEKTA